MPPSKKNSNSSFADTNIPFNKLKEDKNKSDGSIDAHPSERKANDKKNAYDLKMFMGWLGSFVYVFFVLFCIFAPAANQNSMQFLEPCNVEGLMSVKDYKLLKEDANYIQGEIKAINTIFRHDLSNEDPSILQKKLTKYTKKFTALNSTLHYQKESQSECYKANIQKQWNEKLKYIFHAATFLHILPYCISFYYIIKAAKRNPSEEEKTRIIGAILISLIFFAISLMFLSVPLWIEENLLKKFPLN